MLKNCSLLSVAVLLLAAAQQLQALTISESSRSDFQSFSDSATVAVRAYAGDLSISGEIELSPIVQVETSGLGMSVNPIISLTWQDNGETLWAGGTFTAANTALAWRRTPAGVWQSKNATVANARSMALLAVLGDTLYGGPANLLAGGDNIGGLLAWNRAADTWELKRDLNATDPNFDGFSRGKVIWNNALYLSGGRTNSNTFLVFVDGITGDVDFKSLENPPPSGGVGTDYDGSIVGMAPYPVTALGGAERLFWGPLDARNTNFGNIARSREFGAFPVHITKLDNTANTMEVTGAARLQQNGIGDTLFVLLEGGVAGNNVIYTTTDGTNFTGEITKNDLGYSGDFGNVGIGVTEAFAMRAFGRDLWIGGSLDTLVRYVGDFDTFVHLAQTNMTSGIREFQAFRGLDGDTWMAIAGGDGATGRIDRFRFQDSGTYLSDTKTLAIDTWVVADSVKITAKANGGTVAVTFYFGRDTAELNARTFGETFVISGDTRGVFTFNFTKPNPSGRASGNAFKRMLYQVRLRTPNTLITPYFEAVDFNFHQDVTAPDTVTLTAPISGHDTNEVRPRFSWGTTADTVNSGVLESGHDTFLLQIDTGLAGAFSLPHRFVLGPDSFFFVPPFNLGPDTRYLWRVLAFDTAGNVSFSESRVITIDTPPPVPPAAAVAPTNFEDTTFVTITFRWSTGTDSLSGVKQYILEIESGVAPSFASPQTFTILAPDTFRVVGPLGISRADTYYWRVKAVDSATNGSTSAIFAFRIRTPAILSLTDSLGVGRTSFSVLDTITLVVTDTDRNVDFGVADTILVRVTSVIGLDAKTVVLTEDGLSSNQFRGSIALSDTTAVGFLLIGVGDSVTVTYSDSLPPFLPAELTETTATTVRAPSPSVTTFDSTAYRLDTRPFVTITDRDRNRNPLARDSVSVTLWNPSRNDTETLAFFETTDTSGIFTGDTISFSDTVGVILGDSILFVAVGNTIEVRYTDLFDAADLSNDTATILRIFRASSLVAVDSLGASVDSAAPGDTLSARITDPDANLNVVGRDTIAVTVRNLQTGETETIVLRETMDTSGIFGPDTGLASSQVGADTADNDTLFVVLGKTVRFEYADAGDAVDSGTDTITILYRETAGTVDHTDSLRVSIASILRDSGVFVTVTDSDLNRNGTLAETVTVIVRALRSGDSETITLTENGVTSEIFWNVTILRTIDTGAATAGNGIFTVAPSHDTIVAEYADGSGQISDTVFYIFSRSIGRLDFINKQGIVINQFITGETVTARVIDPDQNASQANEGAQETVLVTLANTFRDDTETIVLFESAFLSARFDSITGRATSANPLDSLPNSGALFAIAGDTITVRYADPSDAFDFAILIVVAASTPTPSSGFLSDSIGGSIDTYFIADSFVFATVTDTDENLFPGAPDDIIANIINFATGDSETITLTEIGNDSNIFRNTAGLSISDTRGSSINDGTLFAGRGDTILLRYIDITDATDSSSDSAAIIGETTASVTAFNAASFAVPETATMTVTDKDHNTDPQLVETFSISVRSTTTLDTENVLLTETSETSGVFSGTLALSNLTGVLPNDGTLLVSGGDVIVADYIDAINPTDTSVDTAGITITATISKMAILDSRQIEVETLARGETFTVRVIDADANTNPLTAETVIVVLRNDRTGETENLTLTEISISSETFASTAGETLSSSPADSPAQSGAVFALNGDSIRATYTQGSDSATDTARVSAVPSAGVVRLTDGGGLNRDTYSLTFDAVFIRLRDPDRNFVGTVVETVSISVRIPLTGDFETVTLTEATADTDLFISGGIPIVDSAAVAGNDGVLVAGTSDTALVTYTDATNGDTSSDTALAVAFFRPSTVRLINGAGADIVAYSLADSVRIEVRDPNANRRPLTAETVSVVTRNPRTGETETTTLFETGLFSGVFRFDTGITITSNIADSPAADTIFALSGDSLITTYTDAFNMTDSSTDTAKIVPIATNSATRFTKNEGTDVLTYATDTLVFVTLTDTDQNTLGTAIETVTVTVIVLRTGDSEILSVTELEADTGVFRNLIGLRISDTVGRVIGDGILFGSTLDTLLVTYQDANNPSDSSTDTANVRHESTVSAIALDRSSFAPESGVVVTVTDRSRNANVLGPDTVTVIATDTETNDTETVTLLETTDTSGIFTGPLLLSDTTGAGINGGILLVGFSDTFTVKYTDADDAGDSADTRAFVLTVLTPGRLAFNADTYTANQRPLVTLIDRNRNLDPLAPDTVNVIVVVSRTGETATITLTETGPRSAIFDNVSETLSLTKSASAPSDDTLSISNGDTIVARYDDPADITDTRETTALIAPVPTQGVLTLSAATFKVGDTFTVTLIDDDRNISSFVNDTVILRRAEVTDPDLTIVDNVFNVVVLRETGPTSGVFVPDTPFFLSDTAFPVVSGNQILSSGVDFQLNVEYRDPENLDFAFDVADVLDSPTKSSGSFDKSSYALAETMFVIIVDQDENRHPTKRNLVATVIRNLRSNEVETRAPRETGEVSFSFRDDTGLFLSPFESDSPNGSGRLYVLPGDTLRLEYTDANFAADTFQLTVFVDTIPPTTGVIDLTDAFGGTVTFYRPGDSVYAQLTDTDLNRNPLLAESVTVTIRALFAPDTETVILTEISLNSARFRNAGLRLSDTQGSGAGDGILTAGFTDSLVVVYQDPNTTSDSTSDTVVAAENASVGIVSLNFAAYSLDTPVVTTVTDSDENLFPFTPDTITVTYTTLLGADTETLTLTETSDTSGVFTTAGISLSDTTGGGTNDGILMAGVGDTITVTYVDVRGTVETVAVSASTLRRSTLATLTLDRNTYFPADTAGATLTDTDRNRNPRRRDTAVLALSDARTGDSETILLTETSDTSGRFFGVVNLSETVALTPGDSTLRVQVGDTFQALYTDTFDTTDTEADTASIVPSPTSSTLLFDRETYVVTQRAVITLTDPDQNLDALALDTVTVTVRTFETGDTETVTLTETAAASGIFTNSSGLRLSDTEGVGANNGILIVGAGDTFDVVYVDPANGADSSVDTATFVSITTALLVLDSTAYRLDTRPLITLVDADRNRDPLGRDTAVITLVSPKGDTETLTLIETTDTSGIFTGDTISLTDTVGAIVGDSRLFVGVGDMIDARYTDVFNLDTGLDTATILRIFRTSSITAVDSLGASIDSAAPGDTLSARITDPDANLNVVGRDTIAIIVRNLETGETETIVLLETTDTSGIFGPDTGLASSQVAGDTADNDTLFVVLGKTVRFDYADGADTSTDTITILYRETVGTVDLTDSSHATVAAILRDSGVFVTVTDSDRNRNGTLAETVTVFIQSLRAGDGETITLTENGVTSEVFWNTTGLTIGDTGTDITNNGRLTVRPSGDTVVVTYFDGGGARLDTVTYLFSRSNGTLSFVNRLGNVTNQFTVGDTVTARVLDPDQNSTVAKEGSQETVSVTLTNTRVNDSETIVLFESAFLSARFDSATGIPTAADPLDSLPNGGALFAIPGDTIVVRYTDPSDGTNILTLIVIAASTPTPSSSFFSDSVGASLDTYFIADSFVFATVTDTDENLFPTVADVISATIWCPNTNDTETVSITEIGLDSNIFRNAGLRVSDTVGGAVNDGILLVGQGDTILLIYIDSNDPGDSSNDQADVIRDTTLSSIAFDSVLYAVPDTATVTLTDLDRNIDPRLSETIQVSVRSTLAADTETIVLTESSETSGVFVGTLPLSALGGGAPLDGTLLTALNDVIQVDFIDTVHVGTDTSLDTANIALAPTASRTVALDSSLISALNIILTETMSARVVDVDASANPLLVETVTVVIRNDRTGETETLVLTEISIASETFQSVAGRLISDNLADSLSGSGALYAVTSDTVRATYTQGGDSSFDQATVVPRVSAASVRLINGNNQNRETFAVSADSVFIVLTDTDRNRKGLSVETVTVLIEISRTGDLETTTLTEVDSNSGEFRSVGIPLVDSATVAVNNGALVGGPNDTVLVTYADATNGDTAADTALVVVAPRASLSRFVPIGGAFYITTDSARIEVRDPNANRDPIALDTLPARIRNSRTGETETVTLGETGIFSGIFRFDTGLPLSTDPADSGAGDGVIFVLSSDTVVIDYTDEFDATDTSTDSRLIRPAPTSSVLNFTDAGGGNLAEYSMDSLVFVTLTDTDQNVNGFVVETVAVTAFDTATGDSETILLTELSVNNSVFRNLAGLPLSDTVGKNIDDGILFTGVMYAITTRYQDAITSTDSATDTAGLTRASTASLTTLDRDSYAPETSVFITVNDADRNRDPLARDTMTVDMRNVRRNDTETVLLRETTDTSGVFVNDTGFRLSDTQGFAPQDGILLVALGDTFQASYRDLFDAGDATDTTGAVLALNTASTLSFDRVFYRVADTVLVTVTDRDKNLDPRGFDTITAVVFNTRSADTETLILIETDSSSFIFRNSALDLSDTASAVVNDTILAVGAGDTITLRYTDAVFGGQQETTANILPTPTQATITVNRVAVTEGDTILVRVVDNDRNLNQLASETIVLREIRVRPPLGPPVDNEFGTILLVETTETSGIFVSAPIRFSSAATLASGDNTLVLGFLHTIEVEYRDTPNADAAVETTLATNWFTTASSSSLDRDVYIVGLRVFGTVTDTDQNRRPTAKDTVSITITNLGTGETETRLVLETADRSGILTDTDGLLLTANAADSISGTGLMFVRTGDTIEMRYGDVFDGTDSSLDTAGINIAPAPTTSATFFTDSGGVSLSAYRMDSPVFITVIDTDKNISGTLSETVMVDVFDAATGDSERISLGEITADTGVFRNAVGLRLSDTIGVAINDGLLFTGTILTITARYLDPVTSTDSSTDTATLLSTPSTSALSFDRTAYAPETFVFITVIDADRNRNPLTPDSVTVTLINIARGDTETLTLLETSDTSGAFTNTFGFRISDTQGFFAGDAILLAAFGDTLTARYADLFVGSDSRETMANVLVLSTTETAAFDRASYSVLDSVVLTVVDRDKNLSPRDRDTVVVSVRSSVGGDSELLTLTETDSATFMFRSNQLVLTDTGPSTPGDSVLRVATGETITLRYLDKVSGDSIETAAVITVKPTQGAIAVTATTRTIFDTLQITVTDNDRNLNQLAAETIVLRRVQVKDLQDVVIEDNFDTFILIETTDSSGVFRPATPLQMADTAFPVLLGDFKLTVGLGFTILIEYRDPIQLDFAAETVVIIDSPVASSAALDQPGYALAETAFTTIIDRDENRHPLRRDTVSVIVRNLVTGETETRVLRETGEVSFTFTDDTGLFLSSLIADSVPGDGKLYVRTSDTIQVEYTDANFAADTAIATATIDTIPATVGVVDWIDSGGASIAFYRPGDSVFVMLTDTDRNLNPLITETVSLVLRAVNSPDSETIILTELSLSSGIFRSSGLRLSDTIGLTANDGILAAGFGDSIIADYNADGTADTAFVNERVTVGGINFDSAAYGLDSTIRITVIDADENLNPYDRDTVTVTLTSRIGADTETRILTETTDTSGVFTISGIALSDTTGGGTDDGLLMVGGDDTLTVSYGDTRGTAETVTATATTLRRSTASLLVLNLASYAPTDTVTFTLTDRDRNRNPRVADTAAVSLRDFTTGDSETIVLLENGDTSGVFTGLMPLKKFGAPTNGDGILLVSVGDSILANYIDLFETADTAFDTATIIAETTASSLALDRITYQAANRAVITVVDPDQNLNALVNDTITVVVSTFETNDSETVILTETAAASGIFTNAGGLRLSDTVGKGVNNGTLLIGDNDTFLVLYRDPDDGGDTSFDTATFLRTTTQGDVTASRISVTDGETLTIQVVDPDRNLDPIAAETIVLQNIFVLSPQGATVDNEFQTISLVETTETSGVFVSQPLTFRSTATPTSNDNILLIGFNHSIEAGYLDLPNGDFDTVGVAITWFSTASSSVLDRDIYVVGLRVFGTVTDTDQNRKPVAKDTVSITITNLATGETETRIAFETAERSGILTDTEGVLLSGNPADSTSGTGILFVRTGDTLDVRYVDIFDGTDSSRDTAGINIAPPPTASTTFFSDSNGVSLSAYRMDSLVFVTVIDTDKNLGGTLSEAVMIDVFAAATGDSERISLSEITADTGVFRNVVGLRLSDTIGVSINDGLLFTGTILAITARYLDPLTSTDSSTDTASLQSRPTTSSLSFDRTAYAPETFVFITVFDTDRNRNPLVQDSVTVTLLNIARGDTETLTLLETSDTAGVFVNVSGFRISDTQGFFAGDATLLAAFGDTLTVRYVDAFVATDSRETTARVLVAKTPGTTAFDRVSYRMSDSVVLTVVDRDKNLDPRARDTVAVSVRNTRTGDSETITLMETDSASLTFRANTFTLVETGAAAPGDGRLRVGTGDTIVLRYADTVNGDTIETTALTVVTPSQATITVNDTLTLFDALSITVNDLDRNLNQSLAETIVLRKVEAISPQLVVVESEFETILLLETSETSGVFVLASPLRLADTGFPTVALDRQMTAGLNFTIRVEYLDPNQGDFAFDTGVVVDSPIKSSGAFDKPSYRLAETAFVTIIDRDENRHPLNRDTLVVVVRNVQTDEVETRVLRETGEVSFTFTDDTGLFLSSLAIDSASGNGRLYVKISDTVRLEYSDPNSSDTTFVSVRIDTIPPTAATIDWINITGASVSFYRPGDSVFVALIDTDRNLNPLAVDTAQVVLRSLLSADSETILLTESGINSSLFRSAGLLLSDTLGIGPGDGILTAGFGDSVIVLYVIETIADTVIVADNPTAAFLALNFAAYQLDTLVAPTVQDTDENRSPFGRDTILVTLTSFLGRDTETIILTESADTSGIFTTTGISLSDTTGASVNDGLLMAGAGDTITATYVDLLGTSETRTASAITLRRSTLSALSLDKDTYLSSDIVVFTVVDTDRNRNPRIADSVAVTLFDPTTGDSETIILTETSDTSRIFSGNIPVIKTGAPTNGDGGLLVQPGDTIQAAYKDLFAPTDTAADTAGIVNQPTASALVLDRDSYRASTRAVVTATDLDANILALAADTVLVVFRTFRTNDVETVVLTETAASSGIFVNAGGLRLSDTVGGGASDGILFIGADDTFIVRYIDATDPADSASDTAVFRQTPSASNIDLTQAVYLPGDSIFIIVIDADRNADPLGRDTVSVTIVNRTRNDTEVITLRETSDTSGVFKNDTGVGFELVAAPILFDGKIQALLGDTLTATYVDAGDASDQDSDNASVALPTMIRMLFGQGTAAGDTTIVRVTALDAGGDTIPGLEGLLPIVILSVSGGTGNFLTTSETVIAGFATFVYSKVEQTTLVVVFRISNETFLTTIAMPASGTGARVVSDLPTTGTTGSLIVDDGVFPASARFTVENRAQLADSPSLITLIGIGAANLQNVPNLRTVSVASEGTRFGEHRFRALAAGGSDFTALPGPVRIRISYPDADSNGIVDGTSVTENSLKIYRLNEQAGRFELEPSSEVDAAENFVTATVNHFTIFTIAGGAPVSGFSTVNVYPNPFRPNAGHTHVTFDNIPGGTVIKIFTTDGHRVDEVTVPPNSSTAQWDGRNASRRVVASGVYVYVLESQGGRKVGKIVVIR